MPSEGDVNPHGLEPGALVTMTWHSGRIGVFLGTRNVSSNSSYGYVFQHAIVMADGRIYDTVFLASLKPIEGRL